MATAASPSDFFEGTEKLLEVWFTDDNKNGSQSEATGDLRTISREDWCELLKMVKCEIISNTNDEDMNSYVLSESSMFVTKERFILKTCGTTTLLFAIDRLVELVKEKCGLSVADMFYSRKNYSRPELQHAIHQTFDMEVQHLDRLFQCGAAYVLGRMNRDCWYLYTLDGGKVEKPDQTIELLMWDMCPEKMNIFTKDVCSNGREATQKSGICDIIPKLVIDDFLFDPCGYSMNGLLPGGFYITIHVTPEAHCSYVSFESNVPMESYHDLIEKILRVFNPGKFLVTVFANQLSIARHSHTHLEKMNFMEGYTRNDHQFCNFKSYSLTYTQFSRPVI